MWYSKGPSWKSEPSERQGLFEFTSNEEEMEVTLSMLCATKAVIDYHAHQLNKGVNIFREAKAAKSMSRDVLVARCNDTLDYIVQVRTLLLEYYLIVLIHL